MSLTLEEADSLGLSQEDVDALLALELQFADRSPPNGRSSSSVQSAAPAQLPQPASSSYTANILNANPPAVMALRDMSNSAGVDPRDINNYPLVAPHTTTGNAGSSGSRFRPGLTLAPIRDTEADDPPTHTQENTGASSRIMQLADWYPDSSRRPSRPLRVMNPDSTATSDDASCDELRREPVWQGDRLASLSQDASADNARTPRPVDDSDPTGSGEATPRLRPISRPRVQFCDDPVVYNPRDEMEEHGLNDKLEKQDPEAYEQERRRKLARCALDNNIAYLKYRLDACLQEQDLQRDDAVSVSSWVNDAQDQDDESTEAASPRSTASDVSYDMVSDAEDWDHVSNDLSESENDTEDSDREFVLPFRGRQAEQKKRKASSEFEQQPSTQDARSSTYNEEVARFKRHTTSAAREIYEQEPDIHPDEMAEIEAAIQLSLAKPIQAMPIRDSISETERFRRNQIIEATRKGDHTTVSIDLDSVDQTRDYMPPEVVRGIAKHLFFPDYFNLAISCKSHYKTLSKNWGLNVSKQEYHRTLIKEIFTPLPTKETLPRIQSTFCDVCLYRLPLKYFKIDVYEMLAHRVNHFDSEEFTPSLKTPTDMRLVVCADCEGTRYRDQHLRDTNTRFQSTTTWDQVSASSRPWVPRNTEPSPCMKCRTRDKSNGVCLQHNFKGQAAMGPVWRPSERVYVDGNKRSGLWYRDRS